MGDDKFTYCFDNTVVNHIQCTESDRCAMIISVKRLEWIEDGRGDRPFRFENAWTRHDRYTQVVEESWHVDTSNPQGICDALGGVRERLKSWSKFEFGSV